jgi:cytochrome-b5 reductase
MLQLIRNITKNSRDCTELRLIIANRTENDILFRPELEALAKNNSEQLKIWFTLSMPPDGWNYFLYILSKSKFWLIFRLDIWRRLRE